MDRFFLSLDLPSTPRASCIYDSWQLPLSHCIPYARRLGFDYSPEPPTSARAVAYPVYSKGNLNNTSEFRHPRPPSCFGFELYHTNDVDCSLIRRKQLVFPRNFTFSQCLAVSVACIRLSWPLKSMCLIEATKLYSSVQVIKTLEGLEFSSIKILLAAVVLHPQELGSLEDQT